MLIDAHAHCDFYSAAQFEKALGEMERFNVLTLSVTTRPRDYLRLKRLAERSSRIVPCFGIHPRNAPDYVHNLRALDGLVEEAALIGEIGLDHGSTIDPIHRPAQARVFDYFLERAAAQDKIVNVHMTEAAEEAVEKLEGHGLRRVIAHAYAGPLDVLEGMVDKGYFIGIGYDVILSKHVADIARAVPDHLLLTETDGPFALERLAGSCGMPSSLERVIAKLARLRRTTPEEIEALVEANFRRLTDGDDRLNPVAVQVGAA